MCDDVDYSKRTRALHDRAVRAGVPCITTTGIYPGVSNIMAAHTISLVRKDYARPEDGPLAPEEVGTGGNPKRVLFSYFTAGTGGAGPTILASTFLLAGEAVTAYKDDQKLTFTALAERRGVDFGPGVGRRAVYLYNLPEVDTIHDVLKVPSISTRFGTDPEPWNWAMWLLARVAPKSLLASPVRNLSRSHALSSASLSPDIVSGPPCAFHRIPSITSITTLQRFYIGAHCTPTPTPTHSRRPSSRWSPSSPPSCASWTPSWGRPWL